MSTKTLIHESTINLHYLHDIPQNIISRKLVQDKTCHRLTRIHMDKISKCKQQSYLICIPILDGRNLEKEEVLLRSSFLNRAGIKHYIKSTSRWIAESHNKSQRAYCVKLLGHPSKQPCKGVFIPPNRRRLC